MFGRRVLGAVQSVGRSGLGNPGDFAHSDWTQTGPFRRRRVGVEASLRAANRVKWCFRPHSPGLLISWAGENAELYGNRPTIGRPRSAFGCWLFVRTFWGGVS